MKTPNKYIRFKARVLYMLYTTNLFDIIGYLITGIMAIIYVVSIVALITDSLL